MQVNRSAVVGTRRLAPWHVAMLLLAIGLSWPASGRSLAGETALTARLTQVEAGTYLISRHQIAGLGDVFRIELLMTKKISRRATKLGLTNDLPIVEYHVNFNPPEGSGIILDVAVRIHRTPEQIDGYEIKETPVFKCLSLVYTGSGIDANKHWDTLYEIAQDRGLVPTGNNREVLVAREGYNYDKHVTELQLGVE